MIWILAAGLIAFGTKVSGYLLPASLLENPRVLKVAGTVTIGLLASLIALNAFGDGQAVSVDARLGALIVAIIACYLRAPFLLVVILGAATAALLRAVGL